MIRNEDVNGKILYEDGNHKFIWLGTDRNEKKGVIQTNQYLIIDNGKGILLDPGGIHLFSRVAAIISRFISLDKIETIIFSHQDPDVSSGIALWLGVTSAKIYVSQLWLRFLPHFGIVDSTRVTGIEAAGGTFNLESGAKLHSVPSHFLHSTGCYSIYDDRAKILFTGDIGAAVFKDGEQYLYVEDFEEHRSIMEPFHRRYMASNSVCRKWVQVATKHDVQIIAPQHGALFQGENCKKFFSWFEQLNCGADELDKIYAN